MTSNFDEVRIEEVVVAGVIHESTTQLVGSHWMLTRWANRIQIYMCRIKQGLRDSVQLQSAEVLVGFRGLRCKEIMGSQ